MKPAIEWFEKLRPDLRDRAIKYGESYPLYGLYSLHSRFSSAIILCFCWIEKELWHSILQEALDIEEGRKPDIKPKK